MRIALLAFHFRPDEAVGSIRPENWATWLAQEHEVHVVTRAANAPDDSGDCSYRISRTRSLPIRIIEALNAYRKKARSDKAQNPRLAKPQGNDKKTSSGALVYRMPCLFDFWLPSAYGELKRIRPDLVIATHSPYISIVIALLYCLNNPRTKLWVDFRDLWVGNHISTGLPLLSKLERYLEKRALNRAEVVSTVSQGLQEELDKTLGQAKTQLIYNCPARLDKTAAPTPGNSAAPLTLCYTGTINNGWRDPAPLLQLLTTLQRANRIETSAVKFCVASKNPGNLLEIARHLDASEFVDFKGALSRQASIDLQLQSDILVLLESPAPEARGVLTGKIFEYLATTKPILLIGPDEHSEIYRILKKHNRLLTLAEFEQIITGKQALPLQQAVDYSEISKNQLLASIKALTAPAKGASDCCQTI